MTKQAQARQAAPAIVSRAAGNAGTAPRSGGHSMQAVLAGDSRTLLKPQFATISAPRTVASMPQSLRARARPYDPAADHAAVESMCQDVCECREGRAAALGAAAATAAAAAAAVCAHSQPRSLACADGGTDPLPKYLAAQMAEPGTRVWVAQREGSPAAESLICCQPRGDALWVWGARTLAAARGRGLGALLLVRGAEGGGRQRSLVRLPGLHALRSSCPCTASALAAAAPSLTCSVSCPPPPLRRRATWRRRRRGKRPACAGCCPPPSWPTAPCCACSSGTAGPRSARWTSGRGAPPAGAAHPPAPPCTAACHAWLDWLALLRGAGGVRCAALQHQLSAAGRLPTKTCPVACACLAWRRRLSVVQAASALLEQEPLRPGTPALLAALPPAAAAHLQAAGAAAAELHPRWRVRHPAPPLARLCRPNLAPAVCCPCCAAWNSLTSCTAARPALQACGSAAELSELNSMLRQHRAAAAGCDPSSAAFSWAPVDFKVLALDSQEVEAAVRDDVAWVLPPPPPHCGASGFPGTAAAAGDAGAGAALEVDAAMLVLRRSKWLSASDRQQEVWLAGALAGSLPPCCMPLAKHACSLPRIQHSSLQLAANLLLPLIHSRPGYPHATLLQPW